MEKAKPARKRGILSEYIAESGFDITFLVLVLTLLTIGLVMLFSASYTYAYYYEHGDSTFYFVKQLEFALIGIVAMFAISKIKYEYLKIGAVIGIGVAVLLLGIVLLVPEQVPGFKRWIPVPGIGTFQPSEVAKLALILFCAWGMDKDHKKIVGKIPVESEWAKKIQGITNGKITVYKSLTSLFIYGGVIVFIAGLVYAENHVSGTVLILAIGVVMLWMGEFKSHWFIIGGTLAILMIIIFVLNPQLLENYAGERITAWLDKDYSPGDKRWQINQSLYAIGSGGFLGEGLGNSKQKHLYVSEPQNDFIFSIVCEELGFIGAAIIIILFILLVWRGIVIGMKARDRFGALLSIGIVFQVGLQAALNIAVVTDTIPNTGISLPFFSAGGTSLCILLFEMGIVLGVSRYSRLPKADAPAPARTGSRVKQNKAGD
ncbi:MAG: FtsW/RodA/SpoVE family cell cycle protein [Clostridiales bacterium]|nr:FtsW/RodA/SpoVE family cell cycle protein [Clostridiales bacterium]